MNKIQRLFYSLSVILVSSCIPQRNIEYLGTPTEQKSEYQLSERRDDKIKSRDELYIKISSFDDIGFSSLGTDDEHYRTSFANELSLTLITYTVDDHGFIDFPILGKIQVEGLSLYELSTNLKEELQEYLNQPTVIVKFAFKKVTILGEVRAPGHYSYSASRLNLLEALGLAGDLTEHGNRKKIYLVRENNTTLTKTTIDLTHDERVFGEDYYIKPNDILYVAPRKSMKWRLISTPITLVFSTITTTLLLLNYDWQRE